MAFPSLTEVIGDIVRGALAKASGFASAMHPRNSFPQNPYDELMRRAAPRAIRQQSAQDVQGQTAPAASQGVAHAAYYAAAANGLRNGPQVMRMVEAAANIQAALQPQQSQRPQPQAGPATGNRPPQDQQATTPPPQINFPSAVINAFRSLGNWVQSAFGGKAAARGATAAEGAAGFGGGTAAKAILSTAEGLLSTVRVSSGAMGLAGGAAGIAGAYFGVLRAGVAMNRRSLNEMGSLSAYGGGLQNTYAALAGADFARQARSAAQLAPSARYAADAQVRYDNETTRLGNRIQAGMNYATGIVTKEAAGWAAVANGVLDQFFGKQPPPKIQPTAMQELVRDIARGRHGGMKFPRLKPLENSRLK